MTKIGLQSMKSIEQNKRMEGAGTCEKGMLMGRRTEERCPPL
jgi:hypothetical protein